MTDWMWFLVYFLPGAVIVARLLWVKPIGDRPHWSDFMMVPMAALMWPLMLDGVFDREFWARPAWRTPHVTTFEERDAALEAAYQETIAIPIEARDIAAWEPAEREAFGINAMDEWIIETSKILRNIEWDQLGVEKPYQGIVSRTNGEVVRSEGERQEVRAWGQVEPVKVVPLQGLIDIVVPDGRCYFRSRKGKAIFQTREKAQKARYYACPEGGCGGFHLTSRDPRTTWDALKDKQKELIRKSFEGSVFS